MTTIVDFNGTIRKRADNRWQYTYTDESNKRLFIYARSKRELHDKINDLIKGSVPPEKVETAPAASVLTVAEWLDTWFNNYVTAGKSTRQRYEIDIRLHIVPALGTKPIDQLTSLDLQQLYKKLIIEGLSPKSVKNIHGMLHSAVGMAVKNQLLTRNITEDCSLPKVEKKEMRTLADDKLTTFLDAAADDEFFDAFFVCLFTGMRECELLGLTWDCVDFKRGTIRVYRQYRRQNFHDEPSVWKFSSLKNKKERTIKAPSQVMDTLHEVWEKQQAQKKHSGRAWKNKQNFIFTKMNGDFIQTSQFYRHFKKIVASMGEPDIRFHDLRHTYATLAIQSGTDIKTVSANLGHATVSFTLDQYAHVSEKMKQKSAELMENLIASLPQKV